MWIDPGTAVDSAMSSIASAGLLVYLIEWAKKSSVVRWVTADRKTLLRWMNAASALALAVGLHWVYSTEALPPGVVARFTLDIPTAGVAISGLWAWGKQWALQQMAYDGIVAKASVSGELLAVEKVG